MDEYLEKAAKGELLEENQIKMICLAARNIFIEEENIVSIKAPVIVVGDIHGQFYDLLELLRIGGPVPDMSYLFLGDYVDRGPSCVETITYLTLLKVHFPNRVILLRGNHDTRSITQVYGFFAECQRQCGNPNI